MNSLLKKELEAVKNHSKGSFLLILKILEVAIGIKTLKLLEFGKSEFTMLVTPIPVYS